MLIRDWSSDVCASDLGPLFAHITGYYSFTLGSAGVERSYNDELAGRTLDLSLQEIGDLFVESDRVGDLQLTVRADLQRIAAERSEEHTSELQSLMRISYAVFCLKKNTIIDKPNLSQ